MFGEYLPHADNDLHFRLLSNPRASQMQTLRMWCSERIIPGGGLKIRHSTVTGAERLFYPVRYYQSAASAIPDSAHERRFVALRIALLVDGEHHQCAVLLIGLLVFGNRAGIDSGGPHLIFISLLRL